MQLAKAVHAAEANPAQQTKETRGAVLFAMWNELSAQ
jgi:hypothetical protein